MGLFDTFKVNLNPWDEESVHYENRAKPIMNRRFDVIEKQTDYQASIIEDSLEDHEIERARAQELATAQHERQKRQETDKEVEELINDIVKLEKKAAKCQESGSNGGGIAYQVLANNKKLRYKELTGVDWGDALALK